MTEDTYSHVDYLYNAKADYGINGYLYTSSGCSCCSGVMLVLTDDILDEHIKDLETRMAAAQEALRFLKENPREGCAECGYPMKIKGKCGYCNDG